MMRKVSPFWRVGVLQALAETFLVNAALMVGLLLSVGHVPSWIVQQGLFFLSPICALLCALRLRTSGGRMWWRVLRELIAAAALSMGLVLIACVVILTLASAFRWETVLVDSRTADIALAAVLTMGASGPIFIACRVGVWLWHYWGRLRRGRLLWALTHAHLTLVVALVALMATLGALQVASPGDVEGRFTSGEWAAVLVARLTQTFLPFAGLMALLTVIMLAVVLPPSAIFSYFVSRRTTRRLQRLATATRAVREGDRAARVAVEGEDEVARLQSDFNAMADELERTLQDLEAQRDMVTGLLQSRRDLVVGVSHELRTPVATVRAMLESALEQGKVRPASLRHDLEVMEGEVLRLQRLIDDLFTLSRLEVEQLTMTCRPTDVAPVVQRIVDAVAPLAWSSGRVEVVAELPDELPQACVDEARLEQILANLLRNGVRHTPPGGIVAVVAAAEDGAVRVEVRDTGEGIPAEELPRIWERFYRGENARTDDVRGAGLGLALVKELAEAMGGSVGVESTVGEGSRFVVRLPKSDA
ncbi:MAG: HAMP domain-containing protein [Anaerolineae bacterium]|nr:HAMP domain-containing protein [Anaerolineae bacterium]